MNDIESQYLYLKGYYTAREDTAFGSLSVIIAYWSHCPISTAAIHIACSLAYSSGQDITFSFTLFEKEGGGCLQLRKTTD